MSRLSTLIILATVVSSAMGCVVHTRPEYAHHRHHHREMHREVIVVHRY